MRSLRFGLLVALLVPSVLPFVAVAAGTDAAVVRRPGRFAWADLVTTDPAAAINFYTKTFGWTTQELSGGRERYTLLLNAGQPVGGVAYRKADPASPAAASARWVGSISVLDINRAVSAVTVAGGHVLFAPRQIAGRGWQALVTDPEGSIFGLIVRDGGDPTDGDLAENGWAWAQLLSGKSVEAAAFYQKALGYTVAEDTRSARPDDFLLSSGGSTCAGLTPLPEGKGRPGWLGYLWVAETKDVVAAAKALGARVLHEQDGPDKLQIAIIADPLGGAIGLLSMPATGGGEMKTSSSRLLVPTLLLALYAGCESGSDYSGSSSVTIYGGVGYSSFYDPWYGPPYYGGGGGIIVSPPIHPVRPIATPHMSGGARMRVR